MVNTNTLVHLYADFCELGTLPVKPTVQGFLNLISNTEIFPIFFGFVISQGYPIEQLEEWESKTFTKFNKDSFLKDVVIAIDQVNL
jgi:hypothetical protein